jgi:magnesium transporter
MHTFLKNGIGIVPCESHESGGWINVESPTEDEIKYLVKTHNVPESFCNDIGDVDERPRIEKDEDWTLMIIRVPYKNDLDNDLTPFFTVPLGIIFKDDIFISICFYETDMLSDFFNFTRRKNVIKENNYDIVLRLLLSSNVWFLKYLKQINRRIKIAEKNLEESIRNNELQKLLQIEKSLVFFETSLKGNDVLINRIKNHKGSQIDTDILEEVEIESKQALEMTNIYNNILTGMMDAYASIISNNLNVIMKQLTSISILLMIPTLIASLFGMNVPNDLQTTGGGFWIVFFISLFISIIGAFFFVKRKWF